MSLIKKILNNLLQSYSTKSPTHHKRNSNKHNSNINTKTHSLNSNSNLQSKINPTHKSCHHSHHQGSPYKRTNIMIKKIHLLITNKINLLLSIHSKTILIIHPLKREDSLQLKKLYQEKQKIYKSKTYDCQQFRENHLAIKKK